MAHEPVLSWMLSKESRGGLGPTPDFAAWKARYDAVAPLFAASVERALAGGFLSDRAAFAFACGYQNALQFLVPGITGDRVASFCVTEEEGGHPRAIKTVIAEEPGAGGALRIRGGKKFVTLASEASLLAVACSRGTDGAGRNRVVMALVDRSLPGITVEPMQGIPFVPEISHGTLVIDVVVPASAELPGEGYSDYVRPFRTAEDIHVFAGIAGFLLGSSFRHGWPADAAEDIAGFCCAVRGIAGGNVKDPATHAALAGLEGMMASLVVRLDPHWALADADARERWQRDRRILTVAGQVREKRKNSARERLGL